MDVNVDADVDTDINADIDVDVSIHIITINGINEFGSNLLTADIIGYLSAMKKITKLNV